MATYSKAYGDFSIVDGTHNMLMYDLKLIPYTNVDCLGKNVITGYCLDESENGASIKEGLQLFGLAQPNATLMSDGGSAYSAIADEINMVHILCTHHFQQTIFSSCGGMGDVSDQFKRDANALIFATFHSEAVWEEKFHIAVQTYSKFSSANLCLQKIYQQRKKACRTFTGSATTQRIFDCQY
jgi:hypothetical protein